MLRALTPRRTAADPHANAAARLAWLSLPCAGLADPDGPRGHPRGFSPWFCLSNPPAPLHRAHHEVLDVLVAHPRWGTPAAWQARRPVTGRDLLAACVLDTGADDGDDQEPRRRLFAAMSRVGDLSSPELAEALAQASHPPDEAASRWLRANPQAWLGCQAQGRSPWHFGPNPRLASWLEAMGVAASDPDATGTPGWTAGLVASLRRARGGQDPHEGLAVASRQLALHAPGADWEQVADGRTLRQWVQGHQDLVAHLPRNQRQAGLPSLQVALACGHRPSVDRLVRALCRRAPLSVADASTLIDSWQQATAPPLDLAALLASIKPLLPAFPASASAGWLARAAARSQGDWNGVHSDLAAVWALYPPGQPLAPADHAAVAKWARRALPWSLGFGPNGHEPWACAAWAAMPAAWRGGLAAGLLSIALTGSTENRGFKSPPEWVQALLAIFPHPAHWMEGASPARVRRLAWQLEHLAPRAFARDGLALPAALSALCAAARQARLELEMGQAPAKALSRQRL